MLNYNIHQKKRASILEALLFQATRDAWKKQEQDTLQLINGNSVTTASESGLESSASKKLKNAFKTFNMGSGHYTFNTGMNSLVDQLASLPYKMAQVEDELFAKDKNHQRYLRRDSDPLYLKYYLYGKEKSTVDGYIDLLQLSNPMPFKDIIAFLIKLYQENEDMLFGALIEKNGTFTNITHPFIAQGFIKRYEDPNEVKDNYRLILYTFKEGSLDKLKSSKRYACETLDFLATDQYNDMFKMHLIQTLAILEVEQEMFFKVTGYRNIDNYVSMNKNGSQDLLDVSTYAQFQYESEWVDKEGNPIRNSDYDLWMIPNHVVNDGVVAPFYGMSAVKYSRSRSCGGLHLSPMQSCNISSSFALVNRQYGSMTVNQTSVCTGSFSNDSQNGRDSLNHANLGSPYHRNIYASGSFQFALMCVKLSLSIYSEAFKDLPKVNFFEEKVIEKVKTFEEYKAEHPKATMKKYLEYVKKHNS